MNAVEIFSAKMTLPVFHPALMHINRKNQELVIYRFFIDEATTLFIEVYCSLNSFFL